jgi:DeoR family fructose operon transcriptional repressor
MRYTAAPQRRDELLNRIGRHGYLSSRQAARELEVTEMTIRRDLDFLASEGLVTRVVGGASRPGLPFDERSVTETGAKEAIASRCGELFAEGLLAEGMTVVLDAGTTVLGLVRLLPAGVTVVSHSVPVLSACARRPDLRLIGLGGSYQERTRSFGGPETRRQLGDLRPELAIVSASALRETGLFCQDAIEADTKRAILDASGTAIAVADHGKLEASGAIRIAGWDRVPTLVTDDGAGRAAYSAIAGHSVRVEFAETATARAPEPRRPRTRSPSRERPRAGVPR